MIHLQELQNATHISSEGIIILGCIQRSICVLWLTYQKLTINSVFHLKHSVRCVHLYFYYSSDSYSLYVIICISYCNYHLPS
jgi:hypothetical protein